MESSSRAPILVYFQQILRKNNLAHSHEINPYVCDPCQQAKSKQLPYHISTSVSTVPLEPFFWMFGGLLLLQLVSTHIM